MKTAKRCESCNSIVTTVKHGKKISVECSYCGAPYDSDLEVEDFISEDEYGEDE